MAACVFFLDIAGVLPVPYFEWCNIFSCILAFPSPFLLQEKEHMTRLPEQRLNREQVCKLYAKCMKKLPS